MKDTILLTNFILDKDNKSASARIYSKEFDLSLWVDIWNIDNEIGYDMDFNQYIFDLTNEKDLEQQKLQEHLSNYLEEIVCLVDEKLYELGVFN